MDSRVSVEAIGVCLISSHLCNCRSLLFSVAMANGSERDEDKEISRVRPGLKREFAFALKSKAQYASSIGHTRSRSRHGMNHEDEGWKLEVEGSEKTTLKKIPGNLKELLETGLLEGISVRYIKKGAKTKGNTGNDFKGTVIGTGIVCSCPKCHGMEVFSPNKFEIHAESKNKRPADYIYLENGINLRKLLNACKNASLEALESILQSMIGCASSSIEQNDFFRSCKSSITGGGGEEMLLCRQSPQIFGDLEDDIGRCALCRGHDFSTSEFGSRTIMICDQCEKEYHVSCLKEHGMDDLKELPEGKWFCCKDCSRIHSALEDRVAIRDDFLPEYVMDIVKKNLGDDCISWRLLRGSATRADEESEMLSKSVSIFQDRFDPGADSESGLRDLISYMVFGEARDQDFGGMYCAVLKVNSNIVSAGIIRVFGEEMAELPLVATSTESQRQGYFHVLFSCLENLLLSLNVKKLVLPAANGTESFWTKKYGFNKISKEELMEYQKDHQLMVFQKTTMLQKTIVTS